MNGNICYLVEIRTKRLMRPHGSRLTTNHRLKPDKNCLLLLFLHIYIWIISLQWFTVHSLFTQQKYEILIRRQRRGPENLKASVHRSENSFSAANFPLHCAEIWQPTAVIFKVLGLIIIITVTPRRKKIDYRWRWGIHFTRTPNNGEKFNYRQSPLLK